MLDARCDPRASSNHPHSARYRLMDVSHDPGSCLEPLLSDFKFPRGVKGYLDCDFVISL